MHVLKNCSIREYWPYLVLLTWPVHLSCLSTCCAGLLLCLTVAISEGTQCSSKLTAL